MGEEKVTLAVANDFIRMNNIRATYIALSSTLIFFSIALIIFLDTSTKYILVAVCLVFAFLNYLGSRQLKTDKDLIVNSQFDFSQIDYEAFNNKYKSTRIVNIVLLILAIICFIASIAIPAYLLLMLDASIQYVALFFLFIAIAIHLYLVVKTSSDSYNIILKKLNQLF